MDTVTNTSTPQSGASALTIVPPDLMQAISDADESAHRAKRFAHILSYLCEEAFRRTTDNGHGVRQHVLSTEVGSMIGYLVLEVQDLTASAGDHSESVACMVKTERAA